MKYRIVFYFLLITAILLFCSCDSREQEVDAQASATKVAQEVFATITAEAIAQSGHTATPLPANTAIPTVVPSDTPSPVPTATPSPTPIPPLLGFVPEGWTENTVPGTSLTFGLPPDGTVMVSEPGTVYFGSAAFVDFLGSLESADTITPMPKTEDGKVDAYLGMVWFTEATPVRKLDFLRLIEQGKTICTEMSNLVGSPSHLDELTFDNPPMLVSLMASGRRPCLAGGIVTTDGTIVLSFYPPETSDIEPQFELFRQMASAISYPAPALELPR